MEILELCESSNGASFACDHHRLLHKNAWDETIVSVKMIFMNIFCFLKLVIFSLAKLQRRIYIANCALQYFILNNWHFENQNFMDLCKDLKNEDMKAFNFHDFLEYDLILYFRYAVLGKGN